MARLQGKIALVSGAARGIGHAIAQAFGNEGALVCVTDIDEDAGRETLGGVRDATFARLDVRIEEDWQQVVDHLVRTYGRIDVVVNNAGITGLEHGGGPHDPEHASLTDWHAVHAVNLDGTFLGCKHAIRAMREAGTGSIINVSSRSGLVGIPAAAAYASSKAAIRNHSKSVALWCAAQGLGIRCNSIHPAAIMTAMWDAMLGTGPGREDREAAFVKDTPVHRFGRVEEVAAVAVLLASDEATYVTGSEFNIDGGLLAGSAASPGQ